MKVRRSLLATRKPSATASTEEVSGKAIDNFGELPVLKRKATEAAAKLGHAVTTWHQRGTHDPHGREAFCDRCSLVAIVSTDPILGRPQMYGWALQRRCA